jgi:hypothetical protein
MASQPSLDQLKSFVDGLLAKPVSADPPLAPAPPGEPPPPPPPGEELAIPAGGFMPGEPGDVELRRQRVLQLRFRKMTESAIAAVVGVDVSTVSRDLKWWRESWRASYGPQPTFDPAEMIGESVELYRDGESLAMLEFTRLGTLVEQVEKVGKDGKKETVTRPVSPILTARTRMTCLRTAIQCRQLQIILAQENGLMERRLGTLALTVPDAVTLRNRLRAAGALQDLDLVSDGERAWVGAAAGTPEAE